MAIPTLLQVLTHSKAKKSHQLVLLHIANHINKDGLAWPSYTTLASKTGLHRSWVIKIVHDLVLVGELEVIHGGSPRGDNAYRIPSRLSRPDEIIPGRVSCVEVVESVDPNLYTNESIMQESNQKWLSPSEAEALGLTPGSKMYRKAIGELLPGE